MLRAAISTVVILVLVAACGSAPQGPASSCGATTAGSTGVAGTRIADHTNGYAITLPAGWAQIDLGTGENLATTSTPTIAPASSRAPGAGRAAGRLTHPSRTAGATPRSSFLRDSKFG